MNCPYCNAKSRVTNSRQRAKSTQVWRRRQCSSCRKIWSTQESIDLSSSHRVIDNKTQIEPFSRDILYSSIKDSLQHRKTALQDATALTDTILSRILLQNRADLPKQLIIQIAHKTLTNFDPIAASVYGATHTTI